MDELVKMEGANAPADYVDEEGYLCCGNCRTRKQYMVPTWPLFDGTGRSEKKLVPVQCKCRQELSAKLEAANKAKEHRDNVSRLKSVCFTSPARCKHTFENATMLPPQLLEMAKDYVREWSAMKKTNTGYLCWGDCGTGKSYTAACIANALMEQEVPVLMRNMGDFLNMNWENREELCRDIARYGLVIFDDLGMERSSEFGLETVFRVINARYESGKPTIITTNLSLQELMNPRDLAHKRIYDRVLEMCVPVQFKGPNVRPAIHQKKMTLLGRIINAIPKTRQGGNAIE